MVSIKNAITFVEVDSVAAALTFVEVDSAVGTLAISVNCERTSPQAAWKLL